MKDESKLWLDQAKEHYKDAMFLFQGSRYSASVFFCHQTLEKILKACIVEFHEKTPSKIHKLDRLAQEAKLDLKKEWLEDLAEITRHFWKVRYPDFRKHVYTNKESAEPTVNKTKRIYSWILKKLNQN